MCFLSYFTSWGLLTELVGFILRGMRSPGSTPKPIDPRGPRLNQAVLTVALLGGFLANFRWIAAVFAVVLFLGAAFGPKYGPVLAFYAKVVKPQLSPPVELEDPRPPRFAATIGVVFLVAATIAFVAKANTLGWVLTLIVAALAGLGASTGLCIGCEAYLIGARVMKGRSAQPTAA